MKIIEEKTGSDGLKLFKQAIDNVKPVLEVKSRRVGGATYQVPVEVRADRRLALAMRWIIGYARKRPEKTMQEKLAGGAPRCGQQPGHLGEEEGRYP